MKGECPNPRPDCKYNELGGCFSDVHHLYYPRRAYRSKLEKEFRELPENKEQICRAEHDEKHATERPPEKPSSAEILAALAIYRASLKPKS